MVCSTRRGSYCYQEVESQEFKIRYTQKQIDKYRRQKYINELEKMSKNLFRMFRDTQISASDFVEKFIRLKERLDLVDSTPLDLEYYKELDVYIGRLYNQMVLGEVLSDGVLDDIREAEMSNLNRLQKMKNSNSYKKVKHKHQNKNEDWG